MASAAVPDACPWMLEISSRTQKRELSLFLFKLLMFTRSTRVGGSSGCFYFSLLAGLSLSKIIIYFLLVSFVNNSNLVLFLTHMILKIEKAVASCCFVAFHTQPIFLEASAGMQENICRSRRRLFRWKTFFLSNVKNPQRKI